MRRDIMALCAERPRSVLMPEERVLVCEVVVNLAKTPLKAAKAPEPRAQVNHLRSFRGGGVVVGKEGLRSMVVGDGRGSSGWSGGGEGMLMVGLCES